MIDDDDEDVPRRRGPGSTDPHRLEREYSRAHRRPLHADTSRRPDEPVNLRSLQTTPTSKSRAATKMLSVAIRLQTPEGQPLAGVPVRFRSGDVAWQAERTTAADGSASAEVAEDDAPSVIVGLELCERVDLPPVPLVSRPADPNRPFSMLQRDPGGHVWLNWGDDDDVIVCRPRVAIVEIAGWPEACSVLPYACSYPTPDGPVTVRGALRTALLAERGRRHCLIAGHADTEGKAADNEALSAARARSVEIFLRGDGEAWAADTFANASVADLQLALQWASMQLDFVSPGGIDGDWGPKTAVSLREFRAAVGIDESLPLGTQDWAAFFDLYQQDLARFCLTDGDGLRALRDARVFTEPATCAMGERWPVDAAELDDYASAPNRRVSVLLFDCDSLWNADHDPKGDEIYDGTYVQKVIAVPPEVDVSLSVRRQPAFTPLPLARVWLSVGNLGVRELVANEVGVVHFTTLAGDRICVVLVQDPLGGGVVVTQGFGPMGAV